MDSNNITVEILKAIRDDVRGLRADVGGLTGRVAGLTSRVDGLTTRVDGLTAEVKDLHVDIQVMQRRQTESEMRLATELVGVASAVLQVRDLLREDGEVAALEKKVG